MTPKELKKEVARWKDRAQRAEARLRTHVIDSDMLKPAIAKLDALLAQARALRQRTARDGYLNPLANIAQSAKRLKDATRNRDSGNGKAGT